MIEKIEAGETIRIKGTFKDINGTLTDPSNATCTIKDSTDTIKVDAESMTKESTGVWYYDYTVPADGPTGTWLVTLTGTLGTFTAKNVEAFDVEITTNA